MKICVLGGAICGDPVGVYLATLIVSGLIAIVLIPALFILIARIRK